MMTERIGRDERDYGAWSARAGIVERKTFEGGRFTEHAMPDGIRHADVIGVKGELDVAEVSEEGRFGPRDVDADERERLEGGEGAIEDDDGWGTDGVDETFGGAPILDVPELEVLKTNSRAARGEDSTS